MVVPTRSSESQIRNSDIGLHGEVKTLHYISMPLVRSLDGKLYELDSAVLERCQISTQEVAAQDVIDPLPAAPEPEVLTFPNEPPRSSRAPAASKPTETGSGSPTVDVREEPNRTVITIGGVSGSVSIVEPS